MAVYNTKNITNLYWAYNEGFKVGRDPMGIQNCSITLYGQLLPGMTNQTGHIRYYSFYCWLLSEYNNDRRGAKKYNVDQRNFIRRAELIMAFVMSGQNQNAVAGSLFVSQKRYNTDRKGHYLISEGADYEQNNKYWTYSTGAFGQYYLGQLIYLQLVTVKDNWFYTSSKGKELAHAFCENIPEDVRKHYIDAICKGKLSEEDIKVLRPIGINQLKKGTSEWHYLNTLMIQPDINGSTLRRESIKLFLEAISTKCAINDFPKLQYEQYTANGLEAQFGWHYYYLCETIHYCIESIFWLILETAGENNYLAINRFIDIATKKILEANNNDISTYTIESVSPLITNYNIPIMQDELVDKTQTNQPAEAALKALLLLIKCYDTIIPQSVFNFYNSKTIKEDRDYLLPYLSDIVMKDIPCIVNNFTYFAIRTHCKQIDDNMLLYANKAMRFIILGLHAAISRMTEKDYNYYMPKIELVLINLFDIFGVPNLDAIEDTIEQINLVYEKGISKSDIRCLIDKCTNIKVDNNNYKRWQGYGITKSNKNAQECIKLQELRCI